MPLSAIDTISVAFEHTKQQLFRPFRLGQWLRLALLGLLTGELSSGGSCNSGGSNFSFPVPNGTRSPRGSDEFLSMPHMDPHLAANIFLVVGIALLIFASIMLVFMYVGSVFRFILIESIVTKTASIRSGWQKWHAAGLRFFLWRLLYQTIVFMGLVILVGIPAGLALLLGWFKEPGEHLAPLILGGILLFFLLLLFFLAAAVVYVVSKDFMATIMALENAGFAESWTRLLGMMKTDRGGYAGYIGMKIVLAIVAGIVFGIIIGLLMLVILLPVGGLTAVAIISGKTAGLTWTVGTVTLAIVGVCLLLAVIFCVTALVSVPVTVYFPAYSIYFFASRYPKLDAWLHPPPPPLMPPLMPPVTEPPPIPPMTLGPEPIG